MAEKPGFRYTWDGLMGKSGISEKTFCPLLTRSVGKRDDDPGSGKGGASRADLWDNT